jgi:8-oxo-dGTP pyrophosphatase MutT (NUDIX family)
MTPEQLASEIGSYGIDAVAERLRAHRPETEASARAQRQAAVAMILREGGGGLEALFIKRAEHPLDPWSGHMAFPGGGRDTSGGIARRGSRGGRRWRRSGWRWSRRCASGG